MLLLNSIILKYKRNVLILVSVLLICITPSWAQKKDSNGPVVEKDRKIKVMSYNMRIASPPSTNWGGTDLAAIADVINRNNPNVVSLQEVDAYTKRSGLDSHQAMELAKMTDMEYFFAKAVDRSEGDYGVAILSRFPIKESKGFRLPLTPGSEGEIRGLALIIVEVNDMDVVFISTHFDHLADKDRLVQTEKMIEILNLHKEYPIIVGADFNMGSDNKVMDVIRTELKGCTFCPLTFPQVGPIATLDYIMINDIAAKRFQLLNYYTVEEDYASDHLPLIGEFRIVD